jgi:hypothetical protein
MTVLFAFTDPKNHDAFFVGQPFLIQEPDGQSLMRIAAIDHSAGCLHLEVWDWSNPSGVPNVWKDGESRQDRRGDMESLSDVADLKAGLLIRTRMSIVHDKEISLLAARLEGLVLAVGANTTEINNRFVTCGKASDEMSSRIAQLAKEVLDSRVGHPGDRIDQLEARLTQTSASSGSSPARIRSPPSPATSCRSFCRRSRSARRRP